MKYNAAIITMSDSRSDGSKEDISGNLIEEILKQNDWQISYRTIIPDDEATIQEVLLYCSDTLQIPLILTTGGTGLSPRDHTPEATKAIIEKEVLGISEAMRALSIQKTPHGMLSRGVSGIRKQSLIINLPGSPKAVQECLSYIISPVRHGIDVLYNEVVECGGNHD